MLAGYQDVIVRGLGVNAIWGETGALLASAFAFFRFSLWRFHFE
ncbi:MAG TPA: hypothetical protein QGI62_05615 [Anaerolineales bacterium]|nr:hypothetical protein [Anaerolineales bacterium]